MHFGYPSGKVCLMGTIVPLGWFGAILAAAGYVTDWTDWSKDAENIKCAARRHIVPPWLELVQTVINQRKGCS